MRAHESSDRCNVVISEQFDPDSPESITLHIIRLVSIASNREPIDLEPIGGALDTDALEQLVGSKTAPGHRDRVAVSFDYEGYEVDIDADGLVSLSLQET